MITDENKRVKENRHDNEISIEELKLRQMFGYETGWHLVGKFEKNGSVIMRNSGCMSRTLSTQPFRYGNAMARLKSCRANI